MAEKDSHLMESGWTLLSRNTNPEGQLSMESLRSEDLFGAGSSSEELPYSRSTVKLRCKTSSRGEYQECDLNLEESQALVVEYAASMPPRQSTTLLEEKLKESFTEAVSVNIASQNCIIVSLESEKETVEDFVDFKDEMTRFIENLCNEHNVKFVEINGDNYAIKHLTHHLKDHPRCKMYKTETGNSVAIVVQSENIDDNQLVDDHIKVVTDGKVVSQDLCLNDEDKLKLGVLMENNCISFIGTNVDLIDNKLIVTGYEEDVQASLHKATTNIHTQVSIIRELDNHTITLLGSKAYAEMVNTFIQRKSWKVFWKVSGKNVIVVGRIKKQVELTTDLLGGRLVTINDVTDLELYKSLWNLNQPVRPDPPVTVIKAKRALKERIIHVIKETRAAKSTLSGNGTRWNFFLKKYLMEVDENCEVVPIMSDIDPDEVVLNGTDSDIKVLEKKLRDIRVEDVWIGKDKYVPILKNFPGYKQTPKKIQIFEAVDVRIESGGIEKQKADVIVNSAGPNLCVADAGTVTTSVLTAAGTGATSCLNDYPKPVPVGDVVMGDPGKLACKKIMHAVLAKYNHSKKDESIKQLRDVVECCLSMTLDKGYKSIAFPALCAGVHSYPIEIVAETMLEAIMKIVNTRGRGLESVRIVCLQNDKKKVFDDFVAKRRLAATQHDKCLIKKIEWPTSYYCSVASETTGEIEKINAEIRQQTLVKNVA